MRTEHYEILVENRGRWELVGWFAQFEVASAVFRNRTYRQRLVHKVVESGEVTFSEVLAEIGRTREQK